MNRIRGEGGRFFSPEEIAAKKAEAAAQAAMKNGDHEESEAPLIEVSEGRLHIMTTQSILTFLLL